MKKTQIKRVLQDFSAHKITMDAAIAKLDSITTEISGEIKLADLKKLRLEKGYTLRQVEDLTGISNAHLCQIESGSIKNPRYKIIAELQKLYKN
jgi:hypothetical protein